LATYPACAARIISLSAAKLAVKKNKHRMTTQVYLFIALKKNAPFFLSSQQRRWFSFSCYAVGKKAELVFFPAIRGKRCPSALLFVDENDNAAVLSPSIARGVVGNRLIASVADHFHPVKRDIVFFVEIFHDGFSSLFAEH